MTMSKYFQQVCTKLSLIHVMLALIGLIAFGAFLTMYCIDDLEEEKSKALKGLVISFMFLAYNIILFILIPSFEGVQI